MENQKQRTLCKDRIEAYLDSLREGERSPATIEKYARALRDFSNWLGGDREVDKQAAIDYKAFLMERYAPAGVNAALAALNGFFVFLGWTEYRVKSLRLQRRVFAAREKELTKAEYARLLSAAEARQDQRLALLLQLLAATGIRVSEVRAITLEAVAAGRAVLNLKGKVRTILLPGKLCQKLKKYARCQKIVSGELFRTRSGRPMNRKEIWAQLKTLCREAGVEPGKVCPHNLRHLFARVFYTAQKDIVKLADLLGHSSVETTRIYLLSSGEEHQRALEALHLVI